MAIKICSCFLFFLFCSFNPEQNIVTLKIGTTECNVLIHKRSGAVASLISLHDNEKTGVNAYKSLGEDFKYNLFELKHTGNKLIAFRLSKRIYKIDPNRIFSDIGIRKTLKMHGNFSVAALQQVKQFRARLLKLYKHRYSHNYIISLHNNTDNLFSILSYRSSKNAAEIFINPKKDRDDFFIVTEKSDFEYFKKEKFNVVLQSKRVEDDGSLSVYAARNKIPYINIEAQNGHTSVQVEMLKSVYKLIEQK